MQREDAQREHDRLGTFISDTNKAAITNADLALRTAVLINGGAAVSVLAFVGGLVTQGKLTKANSLEEVSYALALFAFGVAAAALAMGFSYFTNYCITGNASRKIRIWEHPYATDTPASKRFMCAAFTFQAIAVLLGFGSIGLFVAGMLAIKASFAHLL